MRNGGRVTDLDEGPTIRVVGNCDIEQNYSRIRFLEGKYCPSRGRKACHIVQHNDRLSEDSVV